MSASTSEQRLPGFLRLGWILALEGARVALRHRIFSMIAALALLLVIASLVFRTFDFGGDELEFLSDFGFGVIFFFGSLLAILLSSLSWFEALNARTCLPILARPVPRWLYFVAQWAGVALALALFVFGLSAVLGVLLIGRGSQLAGWEGGARFVWESLEIVRSLSVAAFIQVGRLALLAALTYFVGSFAGSALLTATVAFMALLIGQLQPLARTFEASISSPTGAFVFQAATSLVPNLAAFSVDGASLLEGPGSGGPLLALAGYAAVYLVAYLALGAWFFQRRDL